MEISEDTAKLIEKYAKQTHQTEGQVIEYVLTEFLQNQLQVIEKRAKEVNEPVNKLLNIQFARLVEYLTLHQK